MEHLPTTILFATDGSEDAALAAKVAIDISKETGSELHIVHVLEPFPRYAYAGVTSEVWSDVLDKRYREANNLLNQQAKLIGDSGGAAAETYVRRGPVVDEILDLAEEINAGLILMGSRGLGPVKRLLVGSVAEGVVHHASCPVLVARGGEQAWPSHRIVIGDDGSEAAKRVGELAAGIGKLFGATACLMRAYPALPEVDVQGREMNARMVDDELRREERKLQERATEIEEALGVLPRVGIAVGDPATALLEEAEKGPPEKTLLAVGSRGLGTLKRIRLGSVSTKVLHAGRSPVLVHPHLGPRG
jgi:nucleotide-binding universal stress UspA family protein